MDGKRIQEYWNNEMQAMLDTYEQFEILVPARDRQGAAHNGEDGRYVESLIREYLRRYLPKDLEVLTGFILRAAVKTGENNRERKNEEDTHSTQLDIIVYDTSKYPVYQRIGENVIVPPEGVVGIISVKKHLRSSDIEKEVNALKSAAKLCRCKNANKEGIRGPYLALVSMDLPQNENGHIGVKLQEDIFNIIGKKYSNEDYFDDLIGVISVFKQWTVFKKRPIEKKQDGKVNTFAEYILFEHKNGEIHLGFQFIITGILSVYYDKTRNFITRPGFTAFPSKRCQDKTLGELLVKGLR